LPSRSQHRFAAVAIGETSVAIAFAATHRAEAFEACRFAIDRLKEIIPIWKEEYFEHGKIWVGCQTSHTGTASASEVRVTRRCLHSAKDVSYDISVCAAN
jgi:molybdopterin synthase catalytic subunit